MLKATETTRIIRVPTDQDNEGWPLTDGRRRLTKPLSVDGDAEADVFDLRERLPEEFATSESPQRKGRRAKALAERLADTYECLEVVEAAESGGEEVDTDEAEAAEGSEGSDTSATDASITEERGE
jgi:hypothetical protein